MKKLILLSVLLIIGCGIFNTKYKCTEWLYQHLDSTYAIAAGTTIIDDADSEEDAEDICEERQPYMSYCTCKVE